MRTSLTLFYQGDKENLLNSGLLDGMNCQGKSANEGCQLKFRQAEVTIYFGTETFEQSGPLLQQFATNLRANKMPYIWDPDHNPQTIEERHTVEMEAYDQQADNTHLFKYFDVDGLDTSQNTLFLGASHYNQLLKILKDVPSNKVTNESTNREVAPKEVKTAKIDSQPPPVKTQWQAYLDSERSTTVAADSSPDLWASIESYVLDHQAVLILSALGISTVALLRGIQTSLARRKERSQWSEQRASMEQKLIEAEQAAQAAKEAKSVVEGLVLGVTDKLNNCARYIENVKNTAITALNETFSKGERSQAQHLTTAKQLSEKFQSLQRLFDEIKEGMTSWESMDTALRGQHTTLEERLSDLAKWADRIMGEVLRAHEVLAPLPKLTIDVARVEQDIQLAAQARTALETVVKQLEALDFVDAELHLPPSFPPSLPSMGKNSSTVIQASPASLADLFSILNVDGSDAAITQLQQIKQATDYQSILEQLHLIEQYVREVKGAFPYLDAPQLILKGLDDYLIKSGEQSIEYYDVAEGLGPTLRALISLPDNLRNFAKSAGFYNSSEDLIRIELLMTHLDVSNRYPRLKHLLSKTKDELETHKTNMTEGTKFRLIEAVVAEAILEFQESGDLLRPTSLEIRPGTVIKSKLEQLETEITTKREQAVRIKGRRDTEARARTIEKRL